MAKAIKGRKSKAKPRALPPLERIAAALERLSPPPAPPGAALDADAYVWHAESAALQPVPKVAHVSLGLLRGEERTITLDPHTRLTLMVMKVDSPAFRALMRTAKRASDSPGAI